MNDDRWSNGRIANRLLCLAPSAERRLLLLQLRPVPLIGATALTRGGQAVDAVHFIQSGMISMVSTGVDGEESEVGLIGAEGMLGQSLLLGAETHSLDGMVQLGGSALALPASDFRQLLPRLPGLYGLILRYADTFHAQVTQTAVCNNRHQIEQRLVRWLLMAHDRAETVTFPMTHEFLSRMLGVRRPGITLAMGVLQRAGLVQHQRNALTVLDRAGLETACCECYAVVRSRFEWLAPRPEWAAVN